jgi:hypothetical protein
MHEELEMSTDLLPQYWTEQEDSVDCRVTSNCQAPTD